MPDGAEPVLDVRGLKTVFRTREGNVHAVNSVSFHLRPGELLGVVGESGSGKSVTMMSLIGLLPSPPAQVQAGQVLLDGRDILHLSSTELQSVRGARIGFIFQDPMTSLNPVFTVGNQIMEPLRRHMGLTKAQAQARAAELLDLVGIPDAKKRLSGYPHQFSGGMRQRVMIAIALACDPRVLIADEPTTALDVTIQAQILDLMRDLKHRVGAAIVLITHDLGVVAEVAERVVVMYAGRKVEEAKVGPLFRNARHPYTQGLLGSVPKLGSSLDGTETRLQEIPGLVPSLKKKLEGCVFASRCNYATDLCRSVAPGLEEKAPGHIVACHYAVKEAAAA